MNGARWETQAECVGLPTHWWFPDTWQPDSPTLDRARTICAACPVRRPCYAAAVARDEQSGVWGGIWFYRGRRRRAAAA